MKRNRNTVMRSVLLLAGLLPWLAGCALFGSDTTLPPQPRAVGVAAQNQALQEQIRRGHGGEPDTFQPLVKAQAAVTAAQAQSGVEQFAADELAQAQSRLQTAQQLWTAARSEDADGGDDALAQIQSHAHDARRLAQIARYTALGQSNVAQLKQAQAKVQQQRASGTGTAALIGKRVVPGPFGSFSFQPHTAQLTGQSATVIKKLAAFLNDRKAIGIGILAHTDNSAPPAGALDRLKQLNPQLAQQNLSQEQLVEAYHIALSGARARAVAQALVQAGVEPDRIGAQGYGSREPVASNDTAQGRAQNERVEAVIIAPPG